MDNILSINSLNKKFGQDYVIEDLNLEIKKGEIFGFLGRNGAGKSTLINTLTGIVHLSSGEFEVNGMNNNHIDDIKQNLGVMPDTSNLYQHMNAVEFLTYMNGLKGKKENKKSILQLLNTVGLSNTGKKK